jgi:hypothetical protein
MSNVTDEIKKKAFKEFVENIQKAYDKFYSYETHCIIVSLKPAQLEITGNEEEITSWQKNKHKFLPVDGGRTMYCLIEGIVGDIIDPQE